MTPLSRLYSYRNLVKAYSMLNSHRARLNSCIRLYQIKKYTFYFIRLTPFIMIHIYLSQRIICSLDETTLSSDYPPPPSRSHFITHFQKMKYSHSKETNEDVCVWQTNKSFFDWNIRWKKGVSYWKLKMVRSQSKWLKIKKKLSELVNVRRTSF